MPGWPRRREDYNSGWKRERETQGTGCPIAPWERGPGRWKEQAAWRWGGTGSNISRTSSSLSLKILLSWSEANEPSLKPRKRRKELELAKPLARAQGQNLVMSFTSGCLSCQHNPTLRGSTPVAYLAGPGRETAPARRGRARLQTQTYSSLRLMHFFLGRAS